ncbi:UDP-N-acetylmuramate--L-alanine ligase [Pseudoduganella buxea]|uniref:UDP-N-acetylmuramate--L-alanine ligase n=1 Tax=Pseudoduganella buxea TaxID=1949069 RepID=A0A6I3SR17_9BURK|nr:UDP-N-acetylmuramate--L-alanine ligase [Pseudoduganella buxea]MTV51540.1 UDP-N-acetylmuramate--L-alanine ligase [Pseudoduganella buxea]GGB89841.1 UDP-N-acetylmuramate--L-alanine ligase [Pseudoduganella buxea]
MKHKVKNIHFVGIGGSGMSGIAEVLVTLGYNVSGSDLGSNAVTQRLAAMGATVHQGHAAEYIGQADAVVTSTAVKSDNPEVLAARARKIPVVPRAVMLGELMRLKRGIAIAGTHGKTTTTSLVASVLAQGGLDPTFVIGGRLTAAGANARLGSGEYLVAEADESDASFLNLAPMIEVITNIDADHMETYEHDFEKLKAAFVHFTHRLPFYGRAMLCIDDPHVRSILPQVTKPVTTYGFSEEAEVRAINAHAVGTQMHFTVLQEGYPDTDFVLNQPGLHNVQNACSAIAIAREIGIEDKDTQAGLAGFAGVGRRFTRHGDVAIVNGHTGTFALVDDFGHHPVETEVTLAAARAAYPGRRLVLAFQPHRYSRTRDLFEDFAKVLSTVDVLVLTEVYPAGEAPIVGADGRALVRAIRARGKTEPVFVENIADVPETIMNVVRDGDVVLTMGAGAISAVPAKLTSYQKVSQ